MTCVYVFPWGLHNSYLITSTKFGTGDPSGELKLACTCWWELIIQFPMLFCLFLTQFLYTISFKNEAYQLLRNKLH